MSGEDKAIISNLDKPGQSVTCTFRPKEMTFSKQNTWTAGPAKGKNAAELQFGGGGNAKLQLELLFDTSQESGDKLDVRKVTKALWEMTKIEDTTRRGDGKARPPRVQLRWGRLESLIGVIESINEKFVLFTAEGVPLRSVVSVSLTQFKDEGPVPQNPTTRGTAGYKIRVLSDGDTLDLIAFEEYGDAALWRRLAQANNIDDPLRLATGMSLQIPPLV